MRKSMRMIAAAALLLAIGASAALSQIDTLWTRTYGGSANDGFRSVIKTGDGGFLAVGYTYSFGDEDGNVYAVKTSADGDLVWQRSYGGPGRDYGFSACEVGGGFAIAGRTTSWGSGKEDVYVVRIDADGDTVWTRTYGGSARDEGRSICRTSDGCLVVAGSTQSFGMGLDDMYLIKIDAAGDTVWTLTLGGVESDWAQSVCETPEGCYGVGGTSGSNTGNRDICVAKVDAGGSAVWQRYYGSTGGVDPDWGMSVCATPDSGITLAGYQALEGKDPGEVVILGLDKDGTQAYYRKYASAYYQYGCGICATHDGGFVVCGADKNPDTQKNDLLLLKRIPGSGWLWVETVGGAASDWGSSVLEIQPGCFLVAGHTQSYGAGGFDGWLVKLCDAVASVEGESGRYPVLDLAADTNPFGPKTTIRFAVPKAGPVMLAVYDISGRRVAVLLDEPRAAGDHRVVWDGTDSSGRQVGPGIYVARLVSGGLVETEKLILLK
jgi:hypothetical protein